MDGERKINLSEGVPLNSTGAANIFLNTGKSPIISSKDGTVIQLKTEKPSDLGVHINTTFSIASSKKIKLLFVLNFLLCVVCMVLSCSMAIYCWNEMISMRRQLDLMKDHLFVQNLGQDRPISGALVSPSQQSIDRVPRLDSTFDKAQNKKKCGEDLEIKPIDNSNEKIETVLYRDLQVAHFNGALKKLHMGEDPTVGPWALDKITSKNSEQIVELDRYIFTIKESGLYLVYAQIVYQSQSPNNYFVYARQGENTARLVCSCATGDVTTSRWSDRSQISCATQTVVRLNKNDSVNVSQREPNQTLCLDTGYGYIGFVKLGS